MSKLLLGLDIGTSGTKCIICDETGKVLASNTREYPLYTPKPGWAEQDPEDWFEASMEAVKTVLAKSGADAGDIVSVSYSGQMHGLVALNEANEVIRPSILWCDQRTQAECDEITEAAGGLEGLLAYTNNQMLTGYTGGKVLWLKKNEPKNYAAMKVFICPKDYIRFRMTGKIMMDVSDASGTGFYSPEKREWAYELIEKAGLDKAVFPEVVESTACAGAVTKAIAERTGLKEGTPVFAGGGDAVIQTTGAGLIKPGILGVVIGTSGNVSMGMDRFCKNPEGKLQMFLNNEPGLYHAFGCTLTAGGAYRWYRDTLCADLVEKAKATGANVYDLMGELAEASQPGSNGVIFTPYLTGERCPYPDPNARGMFYGLTLATTRADITRSVMEGVTFSLKQVADIMNAFVPCEKVYLSGGGSTSALWRQMTADIFNLPVYTMSAASEGGAYGAVLVAGVGAGVWKNLSEAVTVLKAETETLPDPANQEAYAKAYELYKKLYPANKPVFDESAGYGF